MKTNFFAFALFFISLNAFADSVESKLPLDWNFVIGTCEITSAAQTKSVKFYVPLERVAELVLYKSGDGDFDNTYSLYINNMSRNIAYMGIRSTCPNCFENPPVRMPELAYDRLFKSLDLPSPAHPEMIFSAYTNPATLLEREDVMVDYHYNDDFIKVNCEL